MHAVDARAGRTRAKGVIAGRVCDVRFLAEHVLGQRDDDGPGALRRRDMERVRHELRERGGVLDLDDPLRRLAEQARVVELLERLAAAVSPRHLPDEQDEGRRVLEGGEDADRGLRGARSARHEADAGSARELAVGLGHVRGTRFVAGDDEPDRCVAQRVENREIALAGNAERGVDAVDDELVDEDARAGADHSLTGCSMNTVARCSFGFSSSAGST